MHIPWEQEGDGFSRDKPRDEQSLRKTTSISRQAARDREAELRVTSSQAELTAAMDCPDGETSKEYLQ